MRQPNDALVLRKLLAADVFDMKLQWNGPYWLSRYEYGTARTYIMTASLRYDLFVRVSPFAMRKIRKWYVTSEYTGTHWSVSNRKVAQKRSKEAHTSTLQCDCTWCKTTIVPRGNAKPTSRYVVFSLLYYDDSSVFERRQAPRRTWLARYVISVNKLVVAHSDGGNFCSIPFSLQLCVPAWNIVLNFDRPQHRFRKTCKP